ncbi:MAG: DinB family protein [Acidobacteria bacterium]|nr:DinB family protein [Acidobacteriota bacterium]MCA1652119.1 DinB family protein [Acidobacteriota bacterium]
MNLRAEALANRIEQGAQALAAFAQSLSEDEWAIRVPKDGRAVGVIVHHVASVYPLEVELARKLASGRAIAGVTWDAVAQMNADHAHQHGAVNKEEALALLRRNSKTAADAVRAFTDDELDRAAPVSLNGDAPLTAQFFIEDHALRHSFHHLARIRAAVGRTGGA